MRVTGEGYDACAEHLSRQAECTERSRRGQQGGVVMPMGMEAGSAWQSWHHLRGRADSTLVKWLATFTALVVFAGILASVAAFTSAWGPAAHAKSPPPADLFIRSVVTDDGALGWQQLCPSARAQISEDELIKQANAERVTRAQQGLTLSMDFIGARRRPGGGELRLYIITGHWANGNVDMRVYSVLTQSSGCVEDVNTQ